jgi:phosphate starvation-inducible PhoH-like protein
VRLTIPDSVDPLSITGVADEVLRRIDETFDAMVTVRGNNIAIVGSAEVVEQVTAVFSRLIARAEAGDRLSVTDVDRIIDQASHDCPISPHRAMIFY